MYLSQRHNKSCQRQIANKSTMHNKALACSTKSLIVTSKHLINCIKCMQKLLPTKYEINLKKRRSRKCDSTPNFKSIEIFYEFLSKSFLVCEGDITKRLNTT